MSRLLREYVNYCHGRLTEHTNMTDTLTGRFTKPCFGLSISHSNFSHCVTLHCSWNSRTMLLKMCLIHFCIRAGCFSAQSLLSSDWSASPLHWHRHQIALVLKLAQQSLGSFPAAVCTHFNSTSI